MARKLEREDYSVEAAKRFARVALRDQVFRTKMFSFPTEDGSRDFQAHEAVDGSHLILACGPALANVPDSGRPS
jgi:hypothetical protein